MTSPGPGPIFGFCHYGSVILQKWLRTPFPDQPDARLQTVLVQKKTRSKIAPAKEMMDDSKMIGSASAFENLLIVRLPTSNSFAPVSPHRAMICFMGILFFSLGAMMLMNAQLLTIGNVLFLAGLVMIFGPGQTVQFFQTRWKKVGSRGVVCFFLGILMVMMHNKIWVHPTFGVAMEIFGFLNLFGNFFPLVIGWARHMPVREHYLPDFRRTCPAPFAA